MRNHTDKNKQDKRTWRTFTAQITFVVLFFVLGLFFGLFHNNKQLVESEYLSKARSHFDNIVMTRRWSAQYGGVYVEKQAGMVSNPYLINPDIHDVTGKTYTLKNPALMTREISEIADKGGMYRFHITSLKPLNPLNAPDTFERSSLEAFEKGKTELVEMVMDGDHDIYRYMAPLKTEQSCLKCHAIQGYKVGEVRGGISVSFDITESTRSLARQKYLLIGLFLFTSSLLFGIIYRIITKLNKRIFETQRIMEVQAEKLTLMAHTDPLTGINNRGHFLELLGMETERTERYERVFSVLMLDLDHFKSVNDSRGHAAGDEALHTLCRILRTSGLRASDFFGRIGGEEFAVAFPETDAQGAAEAAERIRENLEKTAVFYDESEFFITASIGVSEYKTGDTQETLLSRADKAMYRAKDTGRNRVCREI
ncbi:MAG: diguanylate cyclase [Desulfuromonadaceae bacterium]|nr:diguanylate cyclase [Desulfuromonadaceae bacterium]